MGACLATDEAASGMKPGVHGTTFGGNPLAMAVGNAVLDGCYVEIIHAESAEIRRITYHNIFGVPSASLLHFHFPYVHRTVGMGDLHDDDTLLGML